MKSFTLGTTLIVAICMRPSICFGDVVLDWNEIALAEVTAAAQLPPDATRSMAMVHVAMFDALDAIEPRYAPYAFHEGAERAASMDAAAASAAHAVLIALFPERAPTIDGAYANALARMDDGDAKHQGIEVGREAANACLSLRAADGSDAPNRYRPRTIPGSYVPTALPVSAQWPKVAPWLLESGAEMRPPPPRELTSPEWTRDYNEIKALGARQSAARSPEQTETARFWAMVGPLAWNPVVRSLAQSAELDPLDATRLFALVYMAAMDAYIAVFDAKYTYEFWRPITAIRNGDSDGNAATERDAAWTPLIDTPMHPEYPCAHCISAGAVGEVLEAQFGRGQVPMITMTSTTAPGVTRRWTRIADYVAEIDDARVWAGVHFRSSTEVGEAMGRKIGALAVRDYLVPNATVRSRPAVSVSVPRHRDDTHAVIAHRREAPRSPRMSARASRCRTCIRRAAISPSTRSPRAKGEGSSSSSTCRATSPQAEVWRSCIGASRSSFDPHAEALDQTRARSPKRDARRCCWRDLVGRSHSAGR